MLPQPRRQARIERRSIRRSQKRYKVKLSRPDYVPITKCPYCHTWVPPRAQYFKHITLSIEVTMLSCPNCDAVLNFDRKPRIKWVPPLKATQKTGYVKASPEEAARLQAEEDKRIEEENAQEVISHDS